MAEKVYIVDVKVSDNDDYTYAQSRHVCETRSTAERKKIQCNEAVNLLGISGYVKIFILECNLIRG